MVPERMGFPILRTVELKADPFQIRQSDSQERKAAFPFPLKVLALTYIITLTRINTPQMMNKKGA